MHVNSYHLEIFMKWSSILAPNVSLWSSFRYNTDRFSNNNFVQTENINQRLKAKCRKARGTQVNIGGHY